MPPGRLWYGERNAINNAIGYAMHSSQSHDAVIRVYDDAGNVIETHEHKRRQSCNLHLGFTATRTRITILSAAVVLERVEAAVWEGVALLARR